jgi:uncharacterized LabA/DUF88 family protein
MINQEGKLIKLKGQRVGVFVDVSNMYHCAKHLYNAHVNFGQILKDAVSSRELIRAIVYVIKADVDQEKAFFEALKRAGYEIQSKDLQVFPGGVKKGDWDVGITVDAITLANRLDAVVLVTGDGDFVPLVSFLKHNKGSRVEVVAFGRSCSGKLIEEADEFLDLDKNPKRYLIEPSAKRK